MDFTMADHHICYLPSISLEENNNLSPFTLIDHLASERTYLAWIRMMAFGFVIVKFLLFVKQIGFVLQTKVSTLWHRYSSIIGIVLVALSALVILFAFI
jgi:putative membrane protein